MGRRRNLCVNSIEPVDLTLDTDEPVSPLARKKKIGKIVLSKENIALPNVIVQGDPTWQASYPKSARRIPRQSSDNGVDGRVFVCLYASYLMNNQTFDFTHSDIPDMRKWLACRIARG